MIRDPIVEDIREARRKTEADCEGDWDKLVEHYRQVEKQARTHVIQGSPRRLVTRSANPPQ